MNFDGDRIHKVENPNTPKLHKHISCTDCHVGLAICLSNGNVLPIHCWTNTETLRAGGALTVTWMHERKVKEREEAKNNRTSAT